MVQTAEYYNKFRLKKCIYIKKALYEIKRKKMTTADEEISNRIRACRDLLNAMDKKVNDIIDQDRKKILTKCLVQLKKEVKNLEDGIKRL